MTINKKQLTGTASERQLDLFVKHRNAPYLLDRHHWPDVRVIGEHTVSADSGGKFLQLASYVRDVFSTQPRRRFVHAFLLFATKMELHIFDRSGAYSARAFDIHQEPEKFIRVVAGYVLMSDEELGLDTFIEREGSRQLVWRTMPPEKSNESILRPYRSLVRLPLFLEGQAATGVLIARVPSSSHGSPTSARPPKSSISTERSREAWRVSHGWSVTQRSPASPRCERGWVSSRGDTWRVVCERRAGLPRVLHHLRIYRWTAVAAQASGRLETLEGVLSPRNRNQTAKCRSRARTQRRTKTCKVRKTHSWNRIMTLSGIEYFPVWSYRQLAALSTDSGLCQSCSWPFATPSKHTEIFSWRGRSCTVMCRRTTSSSQIRKRLMARLACWSIWTLPPPWKTMEQIKRARHRKWLGRWSIWRFKCSSWAWGSRVLTLTRKSRKWGRGMRSTMEPTRSTEEE